MSKIFVIISFIIVLTSKAQTTGVKFAPDRTHWSTSGEFLVKILTIADVYSNIYIYGDTIINTKYCQKVFISNSQYFDTTCLQFHNYMYYNNNKLYTDSTFIGNGTLQYDFNLNVGDSFNLYVTYSPCDNLHNGYYKIPVDTVDSMYYGNKWRKRIVFKQMPGFTFGPTPITWVEGIGDINHGLGAGDNLYNLAGSMALYSVYGLIDFCFCDFGYVRLNCFQEPGYATYGNYCTTGVCANGIRDFFSNNIDIYPNPTLNTISLNIGGISENKNSIIAIQNILGEEIKKLYFTKNIDVSDLAEGCYFLQITLPGGEIYKTKFIKQ